MFESEAFRVAIERAMWDAHDKWVEDHPGRYLDGWPIGPSEAAAVAFSAIEDMLPGTMGPMA